MKKEEFSKLLSQDLELSEDDNLDIAISSLDSIQVLTIISFVDEHFSKTLAVQDIKKMKSVDDLINLIGKELIE